MKETMNELYHSYLEINRLGWIKTMRNGYGGIGYTYESLLNKEEDTFPLADYKGIEIKTMRKNSRRVLHLFNIHQTVIICFQLKEFLI